MKVILKVGRDGDNPQDSFRESAREESAGSDESALPYDRSLSVAVAVEDIRLRRHLLEALQGAALPVMEDDCEVEPFEELISNVERLRPDILFLGLPGLRVDTALAISRLRALNPAPHVVVLNDVADPELILKSMRAGAVEFVYPPLVSSAFEDALRRVIADCRKTPGDRRTTGFVVGFVSAKGGCGATTLACHASSYLRTATKKEVLLADLDSAAGITATIMRTAARYSLEDALHNLHRMDLKLWKGLVAPSPSGVDVMPSPPGLPAVGGPASKKLPQLLRFWRMHYDLALLDLGHGMTQTLVDTIDSVDRIVLVTTNEVLALRQAKQIILTLAARNVGPNRLKLVINRMPKRPQIEIPELEKVMGYSIFADIPSDYQRLNEAYSEPRLLDPASDLSAAIGRFAAKLTGLESDEKKPRRLFGFRGRK